MSKSNETKTQDYPAAIFTERKPRVNRKIVNKNKGIQVAPGLNLQDVPREYLVAFLRNSENNWKTKFAEKHGTGVSMSF